jgi:hypothetical protein
LFSSSRCSLSLALCCRSLSIAALKVTCTTIAHS